MTFFYYSAHDTFKTVQSIGFKFLSYININIIIKINYNYSAMYSMKKLLAYMQKLVLCRLKLIAIYLIN